MRNKKEQSESFKYKSNFTGEFIQAHQYIAEILTDREARRNNKTLTYKYWSTDPHWSKVFKKNVVLAGKYIKTYSPMAIITVVNKESWCYSILPLIDRIKSEQKRIDAQTNIVNVDTKPVDKIETQKRKKGMFKLDG